MEACFLAGSFASGFRFSPAFTSSPNLPTAPPYVSSIACIDILYLMQLTMPTQEAEAASDAKE